MQLLNLVGLGFRNLNENIGDFGKLAFLLSGQADDLYAKRLSDDAGRDDVLRITGS